MCVGDICRRDVITVAPNASLCDAARIMGEKHVGMLVVVGSPADHADRVVQGVLTDHDIVVTVVGCVAALIHFRGSSSHLSDNDTQCGCRDLLPRQQDARLNGAGAAR
jgi:CBS-domain-containing membrane protein